MMCCVGAPYRVGREANKLTRMSICDRLIVSIDDRRDERMVDFNCGKEEKGMEEYTLGVIESRFADIVWNSAPLSTGELVKLCERELGWKRTTTYTVLKKFIERGIFENENSVVKVLISRETFYAIQSGMYVERSFGGSLPGFLAAFTSRKKLSQEEIQEIRKIIENS